MTVEQYTRPPLTEQRSYVEVSPKLDLIHFFLSSCGMTPVRFSYDTLENPLDYVRGDASSLSRHVDRLSYHGIDLATRYPHDDANPPYAGLDMVHRYNLRSYFGDEDQTDPIAWGGFRVLSLTGESNPQNGLALDIVSLHGATFADKHELRTGLEFLHWPDLLTHVIEQTALAARDVSGNTALEYVTVQPQYTAGHSAVPKLDMVALRRGYHMEIPFPIDPDYSTPPLFSPQPSEMIRHVKPLYDIQPDMPLYTTLSDGFQTALR